MGIPSYFSYIIKNHANIIRNLQYHRNKLKTQFTSIYLDCNSIIYDAVREVEQGTGNSHSSKTIEDSIISVVIRNIWQYVELIHPTKTVYIAFDGVAPFAKMAQQRVRRYKTGYMAAINFDSETPIQSSSISKKWNTTAITPGTDFMRLLSMRIKREFDNASGRIGCETVIVSAADEPGEGEHKMFDHMRQTASIDETIAVYGLDADLIMLSLFHVFSYENIYIFREQPEFAKSLFMDRDAALGNGELDHLLLDCRGLAKAILNEMGISGAISTQQMRSRIYDYIFMCFFLGNDFLPHFPALNIRTHGIYTLMEIYKRLIGISEGRHFINMETGNIQWRWVKILVREIATKECNYITNEYETRNKLEKKYYPVKTAKEREDAFNNIPTIYRGEEHYICPYEKGWEDRYYETTFHKKMNSDDIRKACINYFEGLEWVLKYYTAGCPHWKWKYNADYPPLFSDLIKYMPEFETEFIDGSSDPLNKPFKANTQLLYVVPKWNHSLLPKKAKTYASKLENYYVNMDELKFQWTYCKYFWEAHAILPDLSRDEMEKIDK
jgi:5'-3' exonuclease